MIAWSALQKMRSSPKRRDDPAPLEFFPHGFGQPAQVDVTALGFEPFDEFADGFEARGVDERHRSQAQDDVIVRVELFEDRLNRWTVPKKSGPTT